MGEEGGEGEGVGEVLVGRRLQRGGGKTLLDMRLEVNPSQVGERSGEVGGSHKKLRRKALRLSGELLTSIVTKEVGRRGAGEKEVEGETC